MQSARQQGHLAHALLLAGAPGVGKRALADRLALSLLCESVGESGAPCEQCRSCRLSFSGNQPNLRVLTPEFDDKAGRAKRDISIEQIRELSHWLSLSSHYNLARCAIVDSADQLNVSGVNALLKLIEEPPANTYFLLLSARPRSLAPTLLSRCQIVRVPMATPSDGLAWLVAGGHVRSGTVSPDDAWLATPYRFVSDGDAHALRQEWRSGILAVALGRREPLAQAAAAFPKADKGRAPDRDLAAGWVAELQRVLAGLLHARSGGDADALISSLGPRVERSRLIALIDECNEVLRRLPGNVAPQLSVESLMIGWWRLTRVGR